MDKNGKLVEICKEVVFGVPVGISTGLVISILISLRVGQGEYYPCVPQMAEVVGSELGAVIRQTGLCALLGASFGATAVIWKNESWSILKQTGVNYVIDSAAMMMVAYLCYWMEHSVRGFLSYLGIFTAVFVVLLLVQYMRVRNDLKKINSRLK